MAYFRIDEPNKPKKYIKTVDEANGTLEFQDSIYGAYNRSDGIIANSVFQYLQFHFMEKYPELKYMTKDTSW
jgi:hypothetical protein